MLDNEVIEPTMFASRMNRHVSQLNYEVFRESTGLNVIEGLARLASPRHCLVREVQVVR